MRALAERAGTSPSYLSQVRHRVLSGSGRERGVGDRLAAMLERAMDKPPGWLDEAHGAPGGLGESSDGPVPGGEGGSRAGMYPLLSWVQAGAWTEVAAVPPEDQTMIHCPGRCSPDTFVLRVRGHSMAPKFPEGELIFVDPHAAADSGRYVVVCTDGSNEATFKQLVEEDGRRYLRALNPDWPHSIVEATESARICGVVVFRGDHV